MAKANINVGSYMRKTKSGKLIRVKAYNQSRDAGAALNALLKSDTTRPSNNAQAGQFAGGSSVPVSKAMQAANKRAAAAATNAAKKKVAAPKKSAVSKKSTAPNNNPALKTPSEIFDLGQDKKTSPKASKVEAVDKAAAKVAKAVAPKKTAVSKADAPKAVAPKKTAVSKSGKKYTRDSFTPAQKKAREADIKSRLDETLKVGDTRTRNARIVTLPDGGEVAVYSPERARMHREIITEMLDAARANGVPRENKAIVTGGLPGSGKSYTMQNGLGIDTSKYVTINPDEFKDAIAKRSQTPGTEDGKFAPLEMAGVLHEESSDLSKMARDVFESNGFNVILDVTLGGNGEKALGKHRKTVEGLREKGYTVEGVFVDIPHSMSAKSAEERYWGGYARWLNGEDDMGGRYVPAHVAAGDISTRGFNSSNRDNFEYVKDLFSDYKVIDNSVRDLPELNVLDSGTADNAPKTGTADRQRDPVAYLDSLLGRQQSVAAAAGPVSFDDFATAKPDATAAEKAAAAIAILSRQNLMPKTDAERVERANLAAEPVLKAAAAAEPAVSEVLQNLVAKHPDLSLAGFENRLKTEESMKEKIARKSYDKQVLPEEYAGQISDALRYTMVSDNPADAISNFEEALAALKAQGHKIRKIDNAWGPGNAYQGINVDVIAPGGLPWEMQLHTSDSFRLKSSNHADYEIERAVSSTPAEKRAAHQRMVDSWEGVQYPTGWENFGTAR